MTGKDIANPEQAELWNERAGPTWAELGDQLDRLLAPFVPLVLEEAGPLAGRHILDVGCGAGALTLAAARLAGPEGRCLGVDISAPLIEAARARAERQGEAEAEFVQADAQTHQFGAASFDVLISRFGVMFFANPVAAFRNLRSACRPGARLACIAWRSAAENGFMTVAERAAAEMLPDFPKRVENGPGQFGFAEPGRVRSILEGGGWNDVAIRPVDVTCRMPERDLRIYATRMGPVGELLPTLDEAARSEVERRLDAAFRPFADRGWARFTAACWMVTAKA
jgi:SAM-dependent methyltransferase